MSVCSWTPEKSFLISSKIYKLIMLRILQRAKIGGCSGFRKDKWIPEKLCGFRLDFADSANNLRNQLTICEFRLQFVGSVYSCGFRDSLSLLNTYFIICSYVPQTGSGFHSFCCGFRKVACFWSDFEQHSVLAICPWNPKQQRRSK